MMCVAPSAMTTSSDDTAAGAHTGADQGDRYAPVLDDADRMITVLERHVVHRLDAGRAFAHDVAEPAHHGVLRKAERRAMDAGVDDRAGRRVELEQRHRVRHGISHH